MFAHHEAPPKPNAITRPDPMHRTEDAGGRGRDRALDAIAAAVANVVQRPGQPLDEHTRHFMEARFGRELSAVRVHTDQQAAESARALDALAYTIGNHIAFDANAFEPTTDRGRELLAHELAHTVQQRNPGGEAPSGDPHGNVESTAATAGRVVAGGGAVGHMPASSVGVSRAPATESGYDERETARLLAEVNERLKQPAYPGRDRDVAVSEGLTAMHRADQEDEAESTTTPPKRYEPRDLLSIGRNSLPDYDNRVMKELDDELERKRIAEETEQRTEREAAREASETDLAALRTTFTKHGFSRSQVAEILSKKVHPRALAILRHHGLTWPRRGPTQRSVEEALTRYENEQRKFTTGNNAVMKARTESDLEAERKARILDVQLVGLGATTGSFLGAIGGGTARLFTDDEAKIAAAAEFGASLEGALGAWAQAKGQKGGYAPEVEMSPTDLVRLADRARANPNPAPKTLSAPEKSGLSFPRGTDVTNGGAFPPSRQEPPPQPVKEPMPKPDSPTAPSVPARPPGVAGAGRKTLKGLSPDQRAAVAALRKDAQAAANAIRASGVRNADGLPPGWDYAKHPHGPTRRWAPGDPVNMPDGAGNYPAWGTIRERIWRTKATDELAARAAGGSGSGQRLTPLDPIGELTVAELQGVARSGIMPQRVGAEIEHRRIPQRVGRLLEEVGLDPTKARDLTKLGDPSNLDPTHREWHAVVDQMAKKRNPERNPSLKSSLDDREQYPLGGATNAEIGEIIATLKQRGIDLNATDAGRRLKDILQTEKARRGSSATWTID